MASAQEQQRLFDLAGKAQTLVKACQACTLTNNPDATVRANEKAAEEAVLLKMGTGAGNSIVVTEGVTYHWSVARDGGEPEMYSVQFTITDGAVTLVQSDIGG